MRSVGFKWRDYSLRAKITVVVLAPISALLLSCAFIGWLSAQEKDAHSWVSHTLEVRLALKRLERDQSKQTLHSIQTLVSDNPAQVRRSAELSSLLDPSVPADSLNPKTREAIEVMDDEEVRLLSVRANHVERLRTISTVVIAGSILIGVLGGLIATSLLSRNICNRVSQLLESFKLIANGVQFTSRDKSKDELGQLASGLAQTSRVLSERAGEIAELNWRLKTVLRAVTEVSIIAEDPQGRITIFNAGSTKLLGYLPEEVIGRDLINVLHGQAGSCEQSAALDELKAGRKRALQNAVRDYETIYTRKDGLCLQVQVSIAPLKDVTGRLVGFLHVAQDVTPRKLLEAELRQKIKKLTISNDSKMHERRENGAAPLTSSSGLIDSDGGQRLSAVLNSLNKCYEHDAPATSQQDHQKKSPSILIVDDFEATRILLRAYLQGYLLHFASNGEEALHKAIEHSYDLILMDIEMPKMDGYETALRIRAWEQAHGRSRTPIVALSAHEDLKPTLFGETSVWTSHLRKPLSKSQLLSEVKIHLKTVSQT